MSPRDKAKLLEEELERINRAAEDLKQDLREKESELEDLGCWRQFLAKRNKPVKKLTETRKKAWTKTKKKFFKKMQIKQ